MTTGLVDQLRNLTGNSIIAISIRNAAKAAVNESDEERICRMIRSQAMDNYPIMEAILGTELLKKCL